VKPKSETEYKAVITLLRKMKVKTEVYKEPSKEQILKSIEKGAKSALAHIKGTVRLREAKDLLNEL